MDKWTEWYKIQLSKGSVEDWDSPVFELGYTFLKDCKKIEDWGCGLGGFKRVFKPDDTLEYIGIDGSVTPFADIKADLTNYTSQCDGIFMRHVLEHNYKWTQILHNACKSFKKKMCLVLSTPFSDTQRLLECNVFDVPSFSFCKDDLVRIFDQYRIKYTMETINDEYIFNLEKLNLVFYTCFYGSNDNAAFNIPEIPSFTYKCYFYTNNTTLIEKLRDTQWIPIFEDKQTTDDNIESNMVGKHIKTLPHEYKELKDYDYVCFLDSKFVRIDETFFEHAIRRYFIEKNYALLVKKHWGIVWRGPSEYSHFDVWDEYLDSMYLQHRYRLQGEKIRNYIYKQKLDGLSDKTPLSACGILLRNMSHPKIKELGETWYNHIQECGIQDQISFSFVKQLFEECIYSFSESPYTRPGWL